MRLPTIIAILFALVPLSAFAVDINLVFRHGKPIQDRQSAWVGHIEFASWIDDELIVYLSRGDVTCISTKSGNVHWTVQDAGKISDWSLSKETKRLAILAENDTISVIDCKNGKSIFTADQNRMAKILGLDFALPSRIAIAPNDGRLVSHLRDSGGDHLIYTLDNSWTTGKVFVHNIKTNKVISFDGRNGHIELDVSFPTRRLALTGTSTDLTVLDFDGNVIAHKKDATMQRNSSVEFSPSGDRILVGSWDNTLSVFSIVENGK